jgi:catechol 2,3-dioxygenase-like lactoylglutathione lyase family enzyme
MTDAAAMSLLAPESTDVLWRRKSMAGGDMPQPASPPRWRGVNHLALVTNDMDETVRFYVGVLGARLVATVGTPSFRHYFFDFGTNSTLAFFDYNDVRADTYAKPAGIPVPEAAQFDHLSFDLVDEEALLELRARLKNANCEVTDVVDHGFIRSIYFTDPNGIALEASYWVLDPTGHAEVSLDDARFFGDPDPVPAVAELRAGGLQRVPATKLVDGFTTEAEDWVVKPG